jgi:CheY-like chemotaxis protein
MNDRNAPPRRYNVLLVEDNDDDILLTKHAFKGCAATIEFQIARDGLEALAILRRESPGGKPPAPDLILLDLNLPRMDGRQLLVELKQDDRLKIIPTVILTTSAADDDVCVAYRNHASAFMVKSMDLHEFSKQISALVDFWLSEVAVLPAIDRCDVLS